MKGKICCLHRLIIKIVRCNIKCWYIHMLNYLFGCNLSVFQLCVIFDMCYNSSSCSTINHSNSICLSVLPSINLPPTFRHWVWCQLSCGIRLRNIHHLVQLCLFYFLRWFMKVMDWCKVFGLCTHTPSCSIFFFKLSYTGKQEQCILYFTYCWKKKNLITKLWLFGLNAPSNRRVNTQTGRKNLQCLFSTGYILLHGFRPSCSELVWGKLFRELQQEFDKCEKQGFLASCQSKRGKLKQAPFYKTVSM